MNMLKLSKDIIHFKYTVQVDKYIWEKETKQLKVMRTLQLIQSSFMTNFSDGAQNVK
jgi:hypothetical protein